MLRVVISVLLLAIVATATGYYQIKQAMVAPLHLPEPQLVEVQSGTGFNQLCHQWQQKQWLDSCWRFQVLAKLDPTLTDLKAGLYQLSPGTALAAFRQISQGKEHQFSFTIIEGDNLRQVLSRLQRAPYIEKPLHWGDEFLGKPLNEQLEGRFFPDTYHYHGGDHAVQLLTRAYRKMEIELDQAWQQRSSSSPLNSADEALILASIIEKETGVAGERPLIASVFVNRLNKGMRLQTDPTVIYGIGPEFDGNITRAHLREKTPYNTYRIDGLPPTPIAMPSKAALVAAVQPQQSDYYYFVAKGDGSHQFSKRLEDHNRAVRQYQLKSRNDS
ncbi:endolytic transglycosylase MltG [Pseudoalteromonas sp. CO325X]|uniref:endolytic transglycosylase MltG n=1 Tax=Pseudoalteromonas sp. CO325X TaxID=1777262 RepID=UPI00102334FF|nr:endolytic transglycosylase MltG [Pseudoalteromonas sp. CO325X]RZF80081.1 endolytic transglycosylase MltG [Pseudoalteromonas sp. CO325X]